MHKQRWVLTVAAAASFMVGLDALVVTTALPTIRHELGASLSSLEWTVNAYTLSFAVLLMSAAALGDRYGRRRMFSFGVALFGAGSVGCAPAPSAGLLVAARAVQGAGAAFVTPRGQVRSVAERHHSGRRFGLGIGQRNEADARREVALRSRRGKQRHAGARGDRQQRRLEMPIGHFGQRGGQAGIAAGRDDGVIEGAIGFPRQQHDALREHLIEANRRRHGVPVGNGQRRDGLLVGKRR